MKRFLYLLVVLTLLWCCGLAYALTLPVLQIGNAQAFCLLTTASIGLQVIGGWYAVWRNNRQEIKRA